MNDRKELIARLRGLLPSPTECEAAATMLESDAQAIDVAYSQGFVEGERAAIVASAEPQEPVAYLAWRNGKPCWDGDDCVCQDAVYPVDHDDDRTSMPVYLAAPQPQRPRLTDGEVYTAYIEATNQTLRPQDERLALAFARAIEKKVRGET